VRSPPPLRRPSRAPRTDGRSTEFVSAESLYDALPSTGAASSTLPHRKKKRKKKASLKDCSAEFDVALVQKDFQTIARLLADGADPDAPLKDGHALLFHAVQPCTHPSDGGSSCLVRLLARHGADPDVRDERSIAPLHFASQLGTTAAGLALLEMGADIHVRQFQGVQPLALAAAWKRTTLVLHLLAKRADPNDVDELGITALGTTILTRLPPVSTDIVRALMAYGARATAPGAAVSPIHEVILRRDERELARLLRTCPHLVDHPCRVGMLDSIPNITPLYLAIHTAHEPSVRVLLRAGADVNRATRFGERRDTYAVLAVESQAPLTTLTALLRAGADPNHANDTGRTPLHVAAEATSRVVPAHFTAAGAVRLLLQHGADVRATTHTNANVPLHMAVRAGRADVASVLLDDGGADIDAPLRSGATPFMLAAFRGNLHMLRFLHKRGARTDSVLAIGETAMHGAARRGSIACADFLRRLGLSVDASPGGTGFAPLHAAACRGQDAMVRWLVDKRADPAARMDTAWISQCLGKTVKEEDVGTGSVAEVARAFNHTKVAEYVDEVIAARRRDAEKDAEGDAEGATGDEAPPAQGGGPAQGEGPALGELPGPVGPPASVTDDS